MNITWPTLNLMVLMVFILRTMNQRENVVVGMNLIWSWYWFFFTCCCYCCGSLPLGKGGGLEPQICEFMRFPWWNYRQVSSLHMRWWQSCSTFCILLLLHWLEMPGFVFKNINLVEFWTPVCYWWPMQKTKMVSL